MWLSSSRDGWGMTQQHQNPSLKSTNEGQEAGLSARASQTSWPKPNEVQDTDDVIPSQG